VGCLHYGVVTSVGSLGGRGETKHPSHGGAAAVYSQCRARQGDRRGKGRPPLAFSFMGMECLISCGYGPQVCLQIQAMCVGRRPSTTAGSRCVQHLEPLLWNPFLCELCCACLSSWLGTPLLGRPSWDAPLGTPLLECMLRARFICGPVQFLSRLGAGTTVQRMCLPISPFSHANFSQPLSLPCLFFTFPPFTIPLPPPPFFFFFS